MKKQATDKTIKSEEQSKSSAKKALIIICAAVISVLAIAACVYFFAIVPKNADPFDKCNAYIGRSYNEFISHNGPCPDSEPTSYNTSRYSYDCEFLEHDGTLVAEIENGGGLKEASWTMNIDKKKPIEEYADEIAEIKSYYTKKYGEPKLDDQQSEYFDYLKVFTWTVKNGKTTDRYVLKLSHFSKDNGNVSQINIVAYVHK